MPHRGVSFDYLKANITAVRWLGQGPYRGGKNRLVGQETGVYPKLDNAANTGPRSEPNTATALRTGATGFYFGALPMPTVVRDADGMIDYWKLSKLNSLAMTGKDDPAGDGLSLLIINACDLAPLPPDANNAVHLPKLVLGATSPFTLTYRVPLGLLYHFAFIPEISRDLQNWLQATLPSPFWSTTI